MPRLGGTVNGHVDDLSALAAICRRTGAWLHVDAIWGGALAYSGDASSRALLAGLEHADSVSLGPQKWLFTPRLCALTLFPKLSSRDFDETLAAVLPYSAQQVLLAFPRDPPGQRSWCQGERGCGDTSTTRWPVK